MNAENPAASVTAMLGPTNTGKTHYAIERMAAHPDGVIGLPLRLLAREVYDKLAAQKPPDTVALITGEEKIIPPGARWFVCTVESMPEKPANAPRFSFLCVDEIQLMADAERGHIFTDRVLRARGQFETLFLGSDTAKPILRALVPNIQFMDRPRLSHLHDAGARKLSRLPPRSAVVAFSAEDVYRMAEQLRRHTGGAAVVLGALSPRARNAQVALYQSGEVDYLVATDAIGMGLNMDVHHVAFARLEKYDGISPRPLTPAEIGQIAGRAGRHLRDGSFGTTEGLPPFAPELSDRLVHHRFDALKFARWRNADLDFSTPQALIASLDQPAPLGILMRAREADDYLSLKSLLALPDIADRARQRDGLMRLWDVCQTPDFRKTMHESHVRLLAQIYRFLMERDELPEAWAAEQMARLDRTDGDIDTLSARLAHVRTWTFITHRAGWMREAGPWQMRARQIEDRLSDALHDRLTQRFVERRALYRPGGDLRDIRARLDEDGQVMIDDAPAGRLRGLALTQPQASGRLTARLAQAIAPLLRRQAKRMTSDAQQAIFRLTDAGQILWVDAPGGEALVAELIAGPTALDPKFRLIASEALDADARVAVEDKIKNWLTAHLREILAPLYALDLDEGQLSGAARGLMFQWREALGHLGRKAMDDYIAGLTQDDRRALRRAGLRLGALALYAPVLMKPKAQRLLALLWSLAQNEAPRPPLPEGRMAHDPKAVDAPFGWWAAQGYHLYKTPTESRWLRADRVDDIAVVMLNAAKTTGPFAMDPAWASRIGAGVAYLESIARALKLTPREAPSAAPVEAPSGETPPDNPPEAPPTPPQILWGFAPKGRPERTGRAHKPKRAPQAEKKRAATPPEKPSAADSPFAALAALKSRLK